MPRPTSPPELRTMQRWLRRQIMEGDACSGGVGRWIAESKGATRKDRVDIYSEAYILRIAEVLRIDFEAVAKVLGEEAFHRLTTAYVTAHPSYSPNIAEIGRKLPAFLAKDRSSRRQYPFLTELAALEWAIGEAFLGEEQPSLDLASLADLGPEDWARARFVLDPSVRLLRTRWPVRRLREAVDRNIRLRRPSGLRPEHLLVHHAPSGEVRTTAISWAAHETLARMKAGATLAAISAALARAGAKAKTRRDDGDIQSWFRSWVQDGVIRKVELT